MSFLESIESRLRKEIISHMCPPTPIWLYSDIKISPKRKSPFAKKEQTDGIDYSEVQKDMYRAMLWRLYIILLIPILRFVQILDLKK